MYLKRRGSPDRYNINRNKSYFKAVTSRFTSDSDHEDTTSPRSVSVSSTELPEVQKSLAVYIESNSSDTSKFLPSYEEALNRKDSTTSSTSSKTDTINSRTGKTNIGKFKILPDKMPPIQKDEKVKKISFKNTRHFSRSFDDLQSIDNETARSLSMASQTSLDSVLVGPNQIPFSRDAFGRSSISERKGRAHIDATKSEFYNKLKKFKSMEELRGIYLAVICRIIF